MNLSAQDNNCSHIQVICYIFYIKLPDLSVNLSVRDFW